MTDANTDANHIGKPARYDTIACTSTASKKYAKIPSPCAQGNTTLQVVLAWILS
jgi:hypothetical protein